MKKRKMDCSDEEQFQYSDEEDYQNSDDAMQSEEEYQYSSGDGDDEMADVGGDVASRGVKAGSNEEVRLLELSDLDPLLEREIKEVNMVMSLPLVATAALLRQNEWNKERLFDKYYSDSTKVCMDAGVELWADEDGKGRIKLPKLELEEGDTYECQICVDDFSADEVVAAPCGHFFCRECYGDYLENKCSDGPDVVFTKCPEPKCSCLVPPQMFNDLLTDQAILKKYHKYMVHSYVDRNKTMRWCPAPNCEFIVSAPVGTMNVKCAGRTTACRCHFCFKCGEEAHQPSSCMELSQWSEKCQNDSETANWILANTKRCTKCNTRIEKNQGCNHMTCRQCKNEFCWICMGPWADHGANTGGYYKCNKFDSSAPSGQDDDKADSAKRELDRYLHYYQRFHAHAGGQKFAEQQREKTERRMVDLQESSSSMTWIDVQFLREAMEMLIECRRVLKYTYVFGYYLQPTLQKKDLFEHHQENLEKYTEQLSELTELDVEEMQKQRTEIINYTRVTSRFMSQILVAVEEGLEGSLDDAKVDSVPALAESKSGGAGGGAGARAGAMAKEGAGEEKGEAGGSSSSSSGGAGAGTGTGAGGRSSFVGRLTRSRASKGGS